MGEDWHDAGFGLYVHWPYCEAKCPYCDFNSHVARWIDHDAWQACYISQLEHFAKHLPDRKLKSIYFGGGTPSLMKPNTVEAVIATAHRLWGFENQIEITLEANPSSVEKAKFLDFQLAGVNRVSLGVQALNDTDLRRLGRVHSASEARSAIDIAMNVFDRMSFDLIYGRQDQTLEAWSDELDAALSIGSTHLSLYHLTIEQGTAFGDRYAIGKLKGLPDDDLSADMFDLTRAKCKDNGFLNYEVSNFAKNGDLSLHNTLYWSYGDYLGIGPGAHGRLTINGQKYATDAILRPDVWLTDSAAETGKETNMVLLTDQEQAVEMLVMGLRTSTGVNKARLDAKSSNILDMTQVAELVSSNHITIDQDTIIVTDQGRPLLDHILNKIIKTNT